MDGEILYRDGELERAIRALREGIHVEDNLQYSEPPAWILPVRRALGAVLTAAGRYADAERVYRQDLIRHPENGWSLYGLAECLRLQGEAVEASAVSAQLRQNLGTGRRKTYRFVFLF